MRGLRVWDTEKNEYFKATLEGSKNRVDMLLISALTGGVVRWGHGEDFSGALDCRSEDPSRFIVEESIGEKDKNWIEIYEGDNLQWLQNGNTTTGSVKFAGGSFYVENFYFASQDNPCDCFGEDAEFKVIGNIHEPLKDK